MTEQQAITPDEDCLSRKGGVQCQRAAGHYATSRHFAALNDGVVIQWEAAQEDRHV